MADRASPATGIGPAPIASIRRSGELSPQGEPVALPSRPLHVSVDRSGRFLLIAYNNPSGVTVHRLAADGGIGAAVDQPAKLDTGIYAHQVLTSPGNRTAILVARGNHAAGGKAEDPGALKLYDFDDGVLTDRASIAPDGGYGFGPRHIDFHPTRPWVFVSIERQNRLAVYALNADGTLGRDPLFVRDTLPEPARAKEAQQAGSIHVHPGGGFVYVTNRNQVETDGRRSQGLRWRRKQHRGVRHRSDDRRADAHSEGRWTRRAFADVRHRPAGALAGGGEHPADPGAGWR